MQTLSPSRCSILLFSFAIWLAPISSAADFAIVAESFQRASALEQRIAQTHTVEVITIAEADALQLQDWSFYRVIWLLGAANDAAPENSKQSWRNLVDVNGALATFVDQGGVLVVTPPDASHASLMSPEGSYFFPASAGQQSSSSIQLVNHPLITGNGYFGVQLIDSDFNRVPQAGEGEGHWPSTANGDVIVSNQSGATASVVADGNGFILLLGVPLNPESNLTGNLIRYSRWLSQ